MMQMSFAVWTTLLILVSGSLSQSRVEHDTIDVYIEHEKNTLVTVTGSTCFILVLTQEELHQVESDRGLEQLTTMVMKNVIGFAPEHHIFHDDGGLTNNMQHWCGSRDIYLLMRNASTETSTTRTTLSTIPTSTVTKTKSTLISFHSTTRGTTVASPVIMYDRTLSVKAVIVTSTGCFVYRLSEVDKNLMSLGPYGKDLFELVARLKSVCRWSRDNPLPDDKILALSKLKAFADDNFIVAQMVQLFFDRAENIVGKGENAVPLWLQILLGITAVTAALLLLTCLVLCCMRLCGCWTGNILGVGSLRRPVDDTDHLGCWCCRPAVVTADGSYVTQWRNTTSRRSTPIKPEGVWMPHTHPVRNNNQSTQ